MTIENAAILALAIVIAATAVAASRSGKDAKDENDSYPPTGNGSGTNEKRK